MKHKLEIRAEIAEDGYGPMRDMDKIEELNESYKEAIQEQADYWFAEDYELIELDIDFVPTNIHDSWFGAIVDEDGDDVGIEDGIDERFAQAVWDRWCRG